MNLLIDIGNSRLKWAQHEDCKLHSFNARSYAKDDLLDLFDPALRDVVRPEQVFVSNVAGDKIATELTNYLDDKWSIKPMYLMVSKAAAGVTNGYEDFTQLGIDRWLAMISAWNTCRKAICVVDCGTALTVDVVTAAGQHEGGYIVPGLKLMAEVLNSQTRQINSIPGTNASIHLGRSTVEGIGNGALAASVALLDTAYDAVKSEHGSDSQCIITGGYAEDIRPLLSTRVDYDPHLVLNGIATLIEYS